MLRNETMNLHSKKVIAITGGKGGVGKTNIAINLGVALAKKQLDVMLFDGCLSLSSIDVLLNLSNEWNISHFINGEKELQEIILEGPCGVKIIPSASGLSKMSTLSLQEIAGIIQAFNDLHSMTDVLIIDTAPGISPDVLTFSCAADDIIVTMCNDPASLADAYALIKVMSKEYNTLRFNIVVNMVRTHNEGYDLFVKLARVVDRFLDATLFYAGSIPYDRLLKSATQQRISFLESYPSSPAAIAIKQLGDKISRWPNVDMENNNICFFSERVALAKYQQESFLP